MQRDESLAVGNVIQNRFGLSVFDLVDVGVQNEPIKARQRFCCQVFHAVGVLQLDPASFQDRSQFMKPLRRPMMPVVAHEEQFQVSSCCGARGCKHEQQGEGAEERGGMGE